MWVNMNTSEKESGPVRTLSPMRRCEIFTVLPVSSSTTASFGKQVGPRDAEGELGERDSVGFGVCSREGLGLELTIGLDEALAVAVGCIEIETEAVSDGDGVLVRVGTVVGVTEIDGVGVAVTVVDGDTLGEVLGVDERLPLGVGELDIVGVLLGVTETVEVVLGDIDIEGVTLGVSEDVGVVVMDAIGGGERMNGSLGGGRTVVVGLFEGVGNTKDVLEVREFWYVHKF